MSTQDTTAERKSLVEHLVCGWIVWLHGKVYAIKGPIGWCKYGARAPLTYKARYWIRWWVWKVETALFDRYGQSIRDEWTQRY